MPKNRISDVPSTNTPIGASATTVQASDSSATETVGRRRRKNRTSGSVLD